MYAYLVSDRPTVSVHPWWDAVAHGGVEREADEPALETVWAHRDSADVTLSAGAASTVVPLETFRTWALEAAAAWAHRDFRGRVGGMVGQEGCRASVIRIVQHRDRRYARRIEQLARLSATDIHTTAVFVDPDAAQWVSAQILTRIVPGVRVVGHRRPTSWAEVVRAAASSSRGDALAVLDARVELDDEQLERMIAQAEDGAGVIPCSRAFDGTLTGVGSADVDAGLPWPMLQHHPQEDLARLGSEPIAVPLLTGRTFAMPRRAFEQAGAWDTALVNEGELEILSLVLRRHDPGMRLVADPTIRPVQEEPERAFRRRRVEPYTAALRRASLPGQPAGDREAARELIQGAGFELLGWRRDAAGRPSPLLQWRRPSADAQRWAIKICAPAGRQGAVWGDTHFAEGLAAALRRRGHEVVIDAFDARLRPTTYLDDVSVVVRGPYRIDPPPSGVSLQWVISHPDQITRDEIGGFDRVFAASTSWSRSASDRWGIAVEPLLECTDTDKFFPRGLPRGSDIVFVGTARGIARPSVVAPLAAGIPVLVYGPDWRPFIPASAITATSIPNDELPARYETASIVLNDQWPAMREQGFIAMRPFDAVAVGGRVISERVEGIEEIFRGAVVTYRDEAHLVELLREDPDGLFPGDEELAEVARYVRREHSFDARAAVLDRAAAESSAPRRHSGPPQNRG